MQIFNNALQILENQIRELQLPNELLPLIAKLDYPRRGWLKRNVQENGTVESALQHTAKVCLAAQAIAPDRWGINSLTLRRQCLIHELPEILGIDWTPGEISDEEKFRKEKEQIENLLPEDFPHRKEMIDLWEQFENGDLAYYLDKMDAVITAEYYAMNNSDYVQVANEFSLHAHEKIPDDTLRQILTKVQQAARSTNTPLTPETIFPFYFTLLHKLSHHADLQSQ